MFATYITRYLDQQYAVAKRSIGYSKSSCIGDHVVEESDKAHGTHSVLVAFSDGRKWQL